MTEKKKPEDLLKKEDKKSGGARKGAGRKTKLVTPEAKAEWKHQMLRAINQASGNMGVIKKNTFWSLREVKDRFGKDSMAEFKTWFEARRHYNEEIADKLLQERDSGKITQVKYEQLLYTKGFVWVWSIREEKRVEAWQLTRGERKFV